MTLFFYLFFSFLFYHYCDRFPFTQKISPRTPSWNQPLRSCLSTKNQELQIPFKTQPAGETTVFTELRWVTQTSLSWELSVPSFHMGDRAPLLAVPLRRHFKPSVELCSGGCRSLPLCPHLGPTLTGGRSSFWFLIFPLNMSQSLDDSSP